jgi:hypothetical protein
MELGFLRYYSADWYCLTSRPPGFIWKKYRTSWGTARWKPNLLRSGHTGWEWPPAGNMAPSPANLNLEIAGTTYRLAGLRIASDFPLVGVQACSNDAAGNNDVAFRRAPVSAERASAATMDFDGQHIEYNRTEVLLDLPRVGRFLVRAGREILIDPAPASDASEVRAYLLGTAFGMLCHQRGITPLHASAIDVADGCVAFVGASGAGKSTLVAALAQRGHEIISDDVCFLHLDGEGKVQARPGIQRIRLWEDALYALGYAGPGVEREMHGYNKYFVPVRSPRSPLERRHLRRVYELHPATNGDIEVTRLQGAAAIEVLMQNVYRLNFAERLGYKPHAFVVCAASARDVPVFRLSRPKHFHSLEETVNVLEDHLREMG